MAEENTFKALKKWTYEDANAEYDRLLNSYSSCTIDRIRFESMTGWRWMEMYDEYWKRQISFLHQHVNIN